MGCTFCGMHHCAIRHFGWCFEDTFYYENKVLITDSHCPYLSYQLCMIHIIEEAFNVKFNNIVQMG